MEERAKFDKLTVPVYSRDLDKLANMVDDRAN